MCRLVRVASGKEPGDFRQDLFGRFIFHIWRGSPKSYLLLRNSTWQSDLLLHESRLRCLLCMIVIASSDITATTCFNGSEYLFTEAFRWTNQLLPPRNLRKYENPGSGWHHQKLMNLQTPSFSKNVLATGWKVKALSKCFLFYFKKRSCF